MKSFLLYFYPLTQAIIFFLYVPYLQTVIRSKNAEAINVPAQFSFFTIGGIAAIYMWVINEDLLASLIICGHILVGNLALALIALHKQRKWRERLKKDPYSERPTAGEEENS
jgi:uncharacterized protein with PQ loop repeat